jgi:hypothetical protein
MASRVSLSFYQPRRPARTDCPLLLSGTTRLDEKTLTGSLLSNGHVLTVSFIPSGSEAKAQLILGTVCILHS